MPTPAERLAARKPVQVPKERPKVWDCRILELRTALGLSLKDVAGECGISAAALWMIERGGEVRLTNAAAIAAFFDQPIGKIWPRRCERPALSGKKR